MPICTNEIPVPEFVKKMACGCTTGCHRSGSCKKLGISHIYLVIYFARTAWAPLELKFLNVEVQVGNIQNV